MVFGLRFGVATPGLVALLFLSTASEAQPLTPSFSPVGTPYTFTRKTPDVRFAFTLDSSAATEIKDLRIQLTPLIDEQGAPAAAELFVDGVPVDEEKGYPVAKYGHLPVEIRANLPEPGTYTAYLTLIYNGQTMKPVTLTVTRPKPSLLLFDIPAVRFPAGGSPSAEVPVRVSDTSGQQVQVSPPQLTGFTARDGDHKFGVKVSADWTNDKGAPVTDKVVLSGAEPASLYLKLDGIKEPGRYEGTLRLTAPDSTFTEKTFSVYLRERRWVAASWILAGVVASFLLRQYLTQSRPRLLEEVRALDLLQQLEDVSPSTDEAKDLLSSLRRQITKVLTRLGLPDVSLGEVTTDLDVLGKKVEVAPFWIELQGEAARVKDVDSRRTIESALGASRVEVLLAMTLAEAQIAERTLHKIAEQIAAANQTEKAQAVALRAPVGTVEKRDSILRRIKASDLLVSLVVLLVAMVLGLTSLWSADAAWCGWEDRLVALLWGLGLDQFAFTGVKGLMTKLTG